MTNKKILTWVMLVLAIFLLILFIGITTKKQEDIISINKEIKKSVIKYTENDVHYLLNKKDIKEIQIEDLIKKGYLKKIEYKNKICNGKVDISNIKNIKINLECVNR